MNSLTFRQWLTEMFGGALKGAKEYRNSIASVGVGQVVGGGLIAALLSIFLWGHTTPYWIAPVIFVPLGIFLILRGVWNCEKEDKVDRRKH